MNREPVAVRTAITAAVAAVVHLLVLLKVIDLDQGAEAALVTSVDLIAGLAIILLVRPKVTPVADPTLTPEQLHSLDVSDAGDNAPPYTVTYDGYDAGPGYTPPEGYEKRN